MYKVHTVENGMAAQDTISALETEGFEKNEIYIFAHDKDRSENLSDNTDTANIGIKEQGFFESIGNVFRSRGDELRSKMRALGLSHLEAEQFEEELDKGKLVMVASNEADDMKNMKMMN